MTTGMTIGRIAEAACALARGGASSRKLVDEALERALDPAGEGARVFLHLDAEGARRAADAIDREFARGARRSPIAGLPISVKDLFDIEGQITMAGSPSMRFAPAAERDCPAMARLKRAGAVILGRTNLTEFAFSGIGINPHFGTPANPYEREKRRIPGGSSSGAAVSISDGMAFAAIGSDTGGSVRIPSALCGITGFKPTRERIPLDGVFPLSSTLDSVGVLARSVACCAAVDALLAGEEPWEPVPADVREIAAAVPRNYFLEGLEKPVASAFERAVSALSAAGMRMVEADFPQAAAIASINAKGGLSAAEAFVFHNRLGTDLAGYDPLVRERILRGGTIADAEYIEMVRARARLIREFEAAHAAIDVIICPTVPIVAPEIAALQRDPDEFRRANGQVLRNPSIVNFLDRCALSVPCHRSGDAPVGLMLTGRHLGDRALLEIGAAVEQVLVR